MRPRPPPRVAGRFAAFLLLSGLLSGVPQARAAAPAAAPRPCGTGIVPAGLGMSVSPGPIPTMHPALLDGSLYEDEATKLLYRPLVWVNGRGEVDPVQSLAAAIIPSADRTRFTVKLRPWHWSDGTMVTASDVLYDWHIIQALGPAYENYLSGGVPNLIRDVTAADPTTLTFSMTQPVNVDWFELAGLSDFYPLPRQAWGRYSIAEQQTLQSEASFYRVVDGPFRLASLSIGRNAVFVPNERYDGHRPSIARFVIDFLQGGNPLEALQGGQVDIASVPFELVDAAARLRGFDRVEIGHEPLLYSLIPNLANPSLPFLDDARVRRAIARAIDQRQIIDTVFHGLSATQQGFVPTALTARLAPSLQDGPSPLAFDPDAARALLDQAGYHPGPDGVRTGRGGKLNFTVLVTAGAEDRLMMLQLVQADLRRVGIALDVKEVEFNQLIARMLGEHAGWDAVFMGWTILTYPDPTAWFATGSTGNYAHYSNPDMDRMLAVMTRAPDRKALDTLQGFALQQQPMIFLPDGSYSELARPGIGGIDRFLSANGNWTPEYLTLSGPMACEAPRA